jgi:hypothetical protein
MMSVFASLPDRGRVRIGIPNDEMIHSFKAVGDSPLVQLDIHLGPASSKRPLEKWLAMWTGKALGTVGTFCQLAHRHYTNIRPKRGTIRGTVFSWHRASH